LFHLPGDDDEFDDELDHELVDDELEDELDDEGITVTVHLIHGSAPATRY